MLRQDVSTNDLNPPSTRRKELCPLFGGQTSKALAIGPYKRVTPDDGQPPNHVRLLETIVDAARTLGGSTIRRLPTNRASLIVPFTIQRQSASLGIRFEGDNNTQGGC